MRTTTRLILRKRNSASKSKPKLNKKKRKENAKRKDSYFIEKNRYHVINTENSRKLENFKAKQEETRKKKNNKHILIGPSHTSLHAKGAI